MGSDGHVLKYDRKFFFGGQGTIMFPVSSYAAIKQLFSLLSQANDHTITLKQSATASN